MFINTRYISFKGETRDQLGGSSNDPGETGGGLGQGTSSRGGEKLQIHLGL